MTQAIRKDLEVFLHDGDSAIGAVREVMGDMLVINVENAGDFTVLRSVVHDVHFDKVILDARKLDSRILAAVSKLRAAEDDDEFTRHIEPGVVVVLAGLFEREAIAGRRAQRDKQVHVARSRLHGLPCGAVEAGA